jgi:D-beta-D-heptose 7-phosphate kinase / D-beta-D-heptose 1-phosphate adenosyltransferase
VPDKLKKSLKTRRNFLVVGDLMLDRYIRGKINRISPEAPVPVLTVSEREDKLGGAGNVALNLAGLNSQVTLVGFLGEDEAGRALTGLVKQESIILNVTFWERNTITKTRITSGRQQVVRVDDEKTDAPSLQDKELLLKTLTELDYSDYEGILLSDYAKGVCFPALCQFLIEKARKENIPLLIDPKGGDWTKYTGASLVTPNLNELGDALSCTVKNEDKPVVEAADELKKRFSLDSLVVTRSEKGMTLVDQTIHHVPTLAREVYDVSGAGDTVAAGLLRFIADGYQADEAVRLANRAAGIVVGFWGTHPITAKLLLAEPEDESWEEARREGKSLVFTNGCFDLLHPGHMDYLKKARALGDYLIVGLNSDESIKRLKGSSRPINNQDSRQIMVESLSFVDEVILFEEDTPARLIESICPDILVKGGDYQIDEIVGREFAGTTLTIPFVEGYSSSSLIERITKSHG